MTLVRYSSNSLSVILQGSLFFSLSAASCSISSSFSRYGSIISSNAKMLVRKKSLVVRPFTRTKKTQENTQPLFLSYMYTSECFLGLDQYLNLQLKIMWYRMLVMRYKMQVFIFVWKVYLLIDFDWTPKQLANY